MNVTLIDCKVSLNRFLMCICPKLYSNQTHILVMICPFYQAYWLCHLAQSYGNTCFYVSSTVETIGILPRLRHTLECML